MVEPSQRASDDDREHAVVVLRQHLVDGRLTLEEFTDRVGGALSARTQGELAAVAKDLPALPSTAASGRRPLRLTGGMFGHVVKRGRLRLRRRTRTFVVFADLDLDLREATIEAAGTTVSTFVLFGNVDVYLPDGVNVDVSGPTVFGHRRQWGFDAGRADAPTINVRVRGLFATVDVWSVPPDITGDYGDVFEAVKELQRGRRTALG